MINSNYTGTVSALSAQNASAYLPSAYADAGLLAGFKAQRTLLIQALSSNKSAVHEFPFNGGGRATAALQKPLSRGTITLDPKNPAGPPVVQYNTLMNPTDSSIFIAMLRYTRKYFSTSAMSKFGPVEATPGVQYQTDDEIITALKAGVLQPSWAHPSGTCAMMPKNLGGCVGSDLLVYGVKNLSVVDASIMPLIVGAHLQETQYAIAEKAADLIKARA